MYTQIRHYRRHWLVVVASKWLVRRGWARERIVGMSVNVTTSSRDLVFKSGKDSHCPNASISSVDDYVIIVLFQSRQVFKTIIRKSMT